MQEESQQNDIWTNFENLLKHHDWFYAYSDDHRVWRKGQDVEDNIDRLYKSCSKENKEKANLLYKKYNIRLK